jgi:hypothetical protein
MDFEKSANGDDLLNYESYENNHTMVGLDLDNIGE